MAGFIGTSNLVTLRVDRTEGDLAVMDLGDGQRIVAPANGSANGQTVQITVRPEKIKLAAGSVGDAGVARRRHRRRRRSTSAP